MIDNENLFIAIESNMPEENYFTNCFAFLLQKDKFLFRFLLKKILDVGNKAQFIRGLDLCDYKIETQFAERKGIPDIRISIGRISIHIENKIRAPIDEQQIWKYIPSSNMVILLTPKEARLNDNQKEKLVQTGKFIHFTWNAVHSILDTYRHRKIDKKRKVYTNWFIELMEEKGMTSFGGFGNKEYGSAWQRYLRFEKNADILLEDFTKRIKGKEWGGKIKRWDQYDCIGYLFYIKKYKRRFNYWVGFYLENGAVYLVVDMEFRKMFREFYRDKYEVDSDNIADKLPQNFVVMWDKDLIYTRAKLTEIIKGTKNKDKQKKKVFAFVEKTMKQFERSGLIKSLKRAAKEYKPRK